MVPAYRRGRFSGHSEVNSKVPSQGLLCGPRGASREDGLMSRTLHTPLQFSGHLDGEPYRTTQVRPVWGGHQVQSREFLSVAGVEDQDPQRPNQRLSPAGVRHGGEPRTPY